LDSIHEEALLEAARKDPKSFRYFYDAHFKEVFLFIYRRTDDEALSGDIAQQVFLKALQNLNKYQSRGVPFIAWLLRIAANETAQYFRDTQKMRVVNVEQSGIEEICDEDSSSAIEQRENVFKALKQLDADSLELIEMRYFEKRSFKEIGAIKKITENNAKIKVHRILDKIRNFLPVIQ
jgi:RNA polymerase sigma-70 factor, ECF subfamily